MYLIRTIEGTDEVVTTADEVKKFDKNEVKKIYILSEVDYDDLVSTADIRDCICSYIKKGPEPKEDVIDYVANNLKVKKSDVSKVITIMKKEKILYVEKDFGWIGIIETGRR